ncbi:MAG: arsenate reductase ArsC [Luminiphilus sp.]|nr:arsenate reductase ArsC [Luminiphilus sp.]
MKKPFNLLFVCTHNRCRSVLAEAIANASFDGVFRAFSAGSQPAGEIHPLTLKFLSARGIPTEGLRSQSWDDFTDQDFDLVITVCDSAASEPCPLWMSDGPRAHWGMPDPSRAAGDGADTERAFFTAMDTLESRLSALEQQLLEDIRI